VAVKFRDYYEARKDNPDLRPAAGRAQAAERLKEINETYEVLRDLDKRGKYDTLAPSGRAGWISAAGRRGPLRANR
jgi:curved DNA-binding protein